MITPGTLALTALVTVLVVGSKRIRHLGEDLGAAVRSFRKGLTGEDEASTMAKPETAAEQPPNNV